MLDVQLDVRRLFVESFTSVTEKIVGFPLRCFTDKKDFKTGQTLVKSGFAWVKVPRM